MNSESLPLNLTGTRKLPLGKSSCACVHSDAYECARIRDGRHDKDSDDYHRRECECSCHEDDDYEPDDL
jgi:hypothetical protein